MKFNKEKFIFAKDFIFKNNQIHLTSSGKSKIQKFKKLTGSRIGAVFGNDSFKSPFQLWCDLLGMYVEEPDTFFLNAGRVIEPKLKEYAELKTGKRFRTYDPKTIQYDLFKENEIFGGIPDGEEFDSEGNIVSILEIKTAQLDKYKWKFKDNQFMLDRDLFGNPCVKIPGGGLGKWFKNGEVMIPKSYQFQLSLYLYLRNISKGYFCVAFIKNEDYLDPHKLEFFSEFNNYQGYDISENIKLDRKEHLLVWKEHVVDLQDFKKYVDYAKKWYIDHVISGISPTMTTDDLTWFRQGYPELC